MNTAKEMLGEQDDVFFSVAQGRDTQLELRQAMIKIAPESAPAHGMIQLLVGGCDETYIDSDLLRAAEAIVRHAVQHAQKLYMKLGLKLSNFIQK